MPTITIIGDVHGQYHRYLPLTDQHEYTLQLGDMGFDYEALEELDPKKHVFFGGNHDNYDKIEGCPNSLGDFGSANLGGMEFFFVRGEWSIDWEHRRTGVDWWDREELPYRTLERAIKMYQVRKPEIMVTHGCPASVTPLVTEGNGWGEVRPSLTSRALEEMLQLHQPRLWVFGHHHRRFWQQIGRCLFICLDELQTLEVRQKLARTGEIERLVVEFRD
jgi:predicted phosphodiesterase